MAHCTLYRFTKCPETYYPYSNLSLPLIKQGRKEKRQYILGHFMVHLGREAQLVECLGAYQENHNV
jgi:hypothetical protein